MQQCAPQGLPQMRRHPTYLQAAENGKEIVEGHDVAVHGHQPQQPRGADEQQEQERRPQHRPVTQAQGHLQRNGTRGKSPAPPHGPCHLPEDSQLERPFGKTFSVHQLPALSLHYSMTRDIQVKKGCFLFKFISEVFLKKTRLFTKSRLFSPVDPEEEIRAVNGHICLTSVCQVHSHIPSQCYSPRFWIENT